jgi:hypothetical protein
MSTMDPSNPGDARDLTPDELVELDSPAAPWLARKDWASGDLTYKRGSLLGVLVFFFGAAMLVAAYGFAGGMPRSFRESGYAALIPLLITGPVGLALTLKGAGLIIGGLKTGNVRFHLDTVPIPLGGPLRGELRMARPIPPGQSVRLKLQCFRKSVMRGGPNSDPPIISSVVWQDEDTVVSDGSGAISVSFITPSDAPPTKAQAKNWPSGRSTAEIWWVQWILRVDDPSGKSTGLHAMFELPVFKVAETPKQAAQADIRTSVATPSSSTTSRNPVSNDREQQ